MSILKALWITIIIFFIVIVAVYSCVALLALVSYVTGIEDPSGLMLLFGFMCVWIRIWWSGK